MRRAGTALLAATASLAFAAALPAAPARAEAPGAGYGTGRAPDHCAGTAPVVCHFDVAPGSYDVTAVLGGADAGSTTVTAESRRTLLTATPTAAGQRVERGFTVDVREPEGEPTGPSGSPGLDLSFGGDAPRLTDLKVAPARRAQLFLAGDSTVCDQIADPYSRHRVRPAGPRRAARPAPGPGRGDPVTAS